MPINSVIRDKRKECGLTQEQVARYLGVTPPAVNKWENGISCPDIMLLAPLARLLRTDLNTLLCFNENLSEQEIQVFNQEVQDIVRQEGIRAGFEFAGDKIREYPNCTLLIYSAAVMLEFSIAAENLSSHEKKEYEEQILSWYERAAKEQKNPEVRDAARTMLIAKYISLGRYDRAEELVEELPDRPMFDKQFFQCDLLLKQGNTKEVRKLLQRKLLKEINEVQGIFTRLINMELEREDMERAESLAQIAHKAAELFDIWEFNGIAPLIQVALARKDVPKSIELLRELLSAVVTPWNLQESILYDGLGGEKEINTESRFLPLMISELENSAEFEFLRNNGEFQKLFDRFRRQQEGAGSMEDNREKSEEPNNF